MASHYFSEVLGLRICSPTSCPSSGLRFLIDRRWSRRRGGGPSAVPATCCTFRAIRSIADSSRTRCFAAPPSWAPGSCEAARVRSFEPGRAPRDHVVEIESAGERERVRCRWLVDASGRAALLKKQLGLTKRNRHDVKPRGFASIIRSTSTTGRRTSAVDAAQALAPAQHESSHGRGLLGLLIPLPGDRTSVGVVADASLHPFEELASFDRVLGWLDRHEPYCGRIVRELAHAQMDFGALKDYSHDVRRMFSGDRWCLAGDAGVFVDPLYSPGSDFIGLANGFTTDLISATWAARRLGPRRAPRPDVQDARADVSDSTSTASIRDGQCRRDDDEDRLGLRDVLGRCGAALLRRSGVRRSLQARARPTMHRFAAMNVRRQAHFRDWAAATKGAAPRAGTFVDYAELESLAAQRRAATRPPRRRCAARPGSSATSRSPKRCTARSSRKPAGVRRDPALACGSAGPPDTEHLGQVFAVLRPAQTVAQS